MHNNAEVNTPQFAEFQIRVWHCCQTFRVTGTIDAQPHEDMRTEAYRLAATPQNYATIMAKGCFIEERIINTVASAFNRVRRACATRKARFAASFESLAYREGTTGEEKTHERVLLGADVLSILVRREVRAELKALAARIREEVKCLPGDLRSLAQFWMAKEVSISETARHFGVSRQTIYDRQQVLKRRFASLAHESRALRAELA